MTYYVTFKKDNEPNKIGVAIPEKNIIIDLKEAEKQLYNTDTIPTDMINLIESISEFRSIIKNIIAESNNNENQSFVYMDNDVKVLAPIPRTPKNVIAVGLNYKKHSKEFTGKDDISQFPIIFSKAPTSIIGPNEQIESYPQYTDKIDYEAELGVIIGKRGKDIPKDKAEDYIFGYTIINDISVRDRQKRTSQWFLGKSMDTHCPMGPYILDKNEVNWPVELDIKCKVNGEIRQHSNTSLLMFDIPTIISTVSEGLTLEPGDVIATGTCEGVGLGFNPPKFLKPGDEVEVEIEKLGALKNTVI